MNGIIALGISIFGALFLSSLEIIPGILLLLVVVGLFAFGPDVLRPLVGALPQDFKNYLDCFGKLFTGDIAGFQACLGGEQPPVVVGEKRIFDIMLGYEEDKKLPTPVGGLPYILPIWIKNRQDEPIEASFSGYLVYDKDVEIGDRREKIEEKLLLNSEYCTEGNPCTITEEQSDTFSSVEPLDCATKKYKKLVAEVNYPYSSYGKNEFKIADSRKTMDIATAEGSTPTRGPGPVSIGVYFEPDYYILDQRTRQEVRMSIVVDEELGAENYAKITGIKIEREGDEDFQLLRLKQGEGCTCGQWDLNFNEEGKKIELEIPKRLDKKVEHRCMCVYEVNNPEAFLGDDAFKTISLRVTVFYDYTRVVERTDVPRTDLSRCSDITTTTNSGTSSQFCDVGDVTQKLRDAEDRYGIPSYLLVAVAQRESSGEHCRDGQVKTGGSGEVGLMQLMPGKCGFSVDQLSNINNNIDCSASTLNGYYIQYKDGITKDWLDDCSGCCHTLQYQEKYISYRNWDAALRAYNGWNCPEIKVNYVEDVKSIWDGLKRGH